MANIGRCVGRACLWLGLLTVGLHSSIAQAESDDDRLHHLPPTERFVAVELGDDANETFDLDTVDIVRM